MKQIKTVSGRFLYVFISSPTDGASESVCHRMSGGWRSMIAPSHRSSTPTYEYVFDRGLISIFSVLAERDVFLVDLEL